MPEAQRLHEDFDESDSRMTANQMFDEEDLRTERHQAALELLSVFIEAREKYVAAVEAVTFLKDRTWAGPEKDREQRLDEKENFFEKLRILGQQTKQVHHDIFALIENNEIIIDVLAKLKGPHQQDRILERSLRDWSLKQKKLSAQPTQFLRNFLEEKLKPPSGSPVRDGRVHLLVVEDEVYSTVHLNRARTTLEQATQQMEQLLKQLTSYQTVRKKSEEQKHEQAVQIAATAIELNCSPEEIALNRNELTELTTVYIGPLFPGIFALDRLQHIYFRSILFFLHVGCGIKTLLAIDFP